MAPEDYAFELFSLSIRLYFWPGSLVYDRSKRSWETHPSIHPSISHIFLAISRFDGKPTVDGYRGGGKRRKMAVHAGGSTSNSIAIFNICFLDTTFDERKGRKARKNVSCISFSWFRLFACWRAFKYLTGIKYLTATKRYGKTSIHEIFFETRLDFNWNSFNWYSLVWKIFHKNTFGDLNIFIVN